VQERFSYTRETKEVQIGPIELTLKDTKTVTIPVWIGIAAILTGGGLLLVGGKNG